MIRQSPISIFLILSLLLAPLGCGKVGRKKTVPGPTDKVYTVSAAQAIEQDVPNVLQFKGNFIPLARLEVKSDFTGKVQALSVEEGQNLLAGEVLLKIEDEKLPWILERHRSALREAEAQLEYDTQKNIGNGAQEDALEDVDEEEPADQREETEQQAEAEADEDQPEQPQEEFEEEEEENAFSRLARLRRQAQRARQNAQAQNRRRQLAIRQEQQEESEELLQSRQSLNQATIDRIRADVSLTEKQIEGSTLTSGVDGFVNKIYVHEGSLVKPHDVLLEIVKVDPIALSLQIPKNQIDKINKSMAVKVIAPDLGGKNFKGDIVFIGAELSETQEVEVRVEVINRDLRIKVGMEGIAQLGTQDSKHRAILVPSNAVVERDNKTYVYILRGQLAVRVPVTTGATLNGLIEVKGGVKPGTAVVTQGVDELQEEEEFVKGSR